MERLSRNSLFLTQLKKTKHPTAVKKLISRATKDQIDSISEIALNMLKGNVAISPAHLRVLKKYSNPLRALTKKRTSLRRRKQLLNQGGGSLASFLGKIFTPVLKFIGLT